MRITKAAIEDVEPLLSGSKLRWDDELKGFGLRVTSSGAASFIVQQRIKGRSRRITFGPYRKLPVEDAREMAKGLMGDIAKDGDLSVLARFICSRKSLVSGC